MLPTNPHPCQSSQCYQIPLRTDCCPHTELSPTFCLSPPQTSPVTPIVDFSYRASQNIGRAIAFRLGTRLERVSYRSFLLGGNTTWASVTISSSKLCERRRKKETKKLSALSQSLFRCMNNKTNIWEAFVTRYSTRRWTRSIISSSGVTRGIRQTFSYFTKYSEDCDKNERKYFSSSYAQLNNYINDNRDNSCT